MKRANLPSRRPKVSDGEVLLAGWRLEEQLALAWLIDHEDVSVTAATLQAAVTQLHQRVIELTDYAEYSLEFAPALPPEIVADDAEYAEAASLAEATPDAAPPPTAPECRVDWTLLDDGKTFKLWCVDLPRLEATSTVFPLAQSDLLGRLTQQFGVRPRLAFITPSPIKATPSIDWGRVRSTSTPEYRFVAPNSIVRIENASALFSQGHCVTCGRPRGTRTTEAAVLPKVERDQQAVSADCGGGRLSVFSSAFVASLTDLEQDELLLRPVMIRTRTKEQFQELLGGRRVVPLAALPGIEAESGCPVCGFPSSRWYRVVNAKGGKELPWHYVLESAVPGEFPPLIVLRGSPVELILAVRADRWTELVKLPSSKGIKSYPLGVLRYSSPS